MARDEVYDLLKEQGKRNHDTRVQATPQRIAFAKSRFEQLGIEYSLKNEETGHFHAKRKSDGKLYQFYAGTGKIQGEENKRGINALIKLLSR